MQKPWARMNPWHREWAEPLHVSSGICLAPHISLHLHLGDWRALPSSNELRMRRALQTPKECAPNLVRRYWRRPLPAWNLKPWIENDCIANWVHKSAALLTIKLVNWQKPAARQNPLLVESTIETNSNSNCKACNEVPKSEFLWWCISYPFKHEGTNWN